MPRIDPSLVPTINPGGLFDRFTNDTQLTIRFYVPVDPVSSSALNRPLGDIALRQLIIAKTLDALNIRLGHQALFPYLIQPQVTNGSTNVDVPLSWIWDMHISLPKKWERLRLSKFTRLSGLNPTTSSTEYDGLVRLIFTGQEEGSTTEVSLFQVDYQIDSTLTYQVKRITVPPIGESLTVPSGQSETIDGFVTFKTMDTTDETVQAFLDTIEPPTDTTAVDSSGLYLNPISVEVNDSPAGGTSSSNDFDFTAVSHGTGVLTLSAWGPIPQLDSDVSTWINTFNYPYDVEATLIASNSTGVTIPKGLFREFNIIAPDNDNPTGDSTGNYYPVYVNRIVRLDAPADNVRFYFATYNVESPSIVPIEFGTLDLARDMAANQIVPIVPGENLFPTQAGNTNWLQGFGHGAVVLSDLWGSTSADVTDFFDSFLPIIDEPAQAVFTTESTRISSFGVSRVPHTVPTAGQSAALRGTRDGSDEPNADNRFVVEADQGLGTQIDFATNTSLTASQRDNPDIERYGWTGSLVHKSVKLVINSNGEDHDYDTDVLPRLRILLGRDPVYGDEWFDGTRFKKYSGDAWIG